MQYIYNIYIYVMTTYIYIYIYIYIYLEMIDDNDRNFRINQSLSRLETKCHCLFIIYC